VGGLESFDDPDESCSVLKDLDLLVGQRPPKVLRYVARVDRPGGPQGLQAFFCQDGVEYPPVGETCAFSPATRLLQTVRSLPKLLRQLSVAEGGLPTRGAARAGRGVGAAARRLV
jgi:hypothetical protein